MFPIPLKSLNEKERHDYILNTYVLNKAQSTDSRKYKRDIDVIRENHRFLWDSSDTADSWEKQLARRYYDKLFKEYCISDLSRYKENKVALRWRVESEVISGKGQFECGNRKCEQREGLRSWEVNFAYLEEGQRKNALVKLRLCPQHSTQLNYTSQKREIKRLKQMEKLQKREKKHSRKSQKYRNDKNTSDDEHNNNESKAAENATQSSTSIKMDKNTKGDDMEEPADNILVQKIKPHSKEHLRETEFECFLEDLLL